MDNQNGSDSDSVPRKESSVTHCGKPSTSPLLCVLVAIFALGSWIDINGLWVELPLIVEKAPEKWSLPSFLVIISQVGNVGPLLFLLAVYVSKGRLTERPIIYFILCVGLLSCLFLSWFWDSAVLVGSLGQHSVPLLTLAMCLGLVDCTSSVTFLPYMATFPGVYLTALYVGEGFSGVLPAVVALIQGVGGEAECRNVTKTDANGTNTTSVVPFYLPARFQVSTFMLFLAFMLLLSLIAYMILDNVPSLQVYRIRRPGRKLDHSLKVISDSDTPSTSHNSHLDNSSTRIVGNGRQQAYYLTNPGGTTELDVSIEEEDEIPTEIDTSTEYTMEELNLLESRDFEGYIEMENARDYCCTYHSSSEEDYEMERMHCGQPCAHHLVQLYAIGVRKYEIIYSKKRRSKSMMKKDNERMSRTVRLKNQIMKWEDHVNKHLFY